MQKLHFSISIQAPPQKVWDVMLSDATYRQWTAFFSPNSHFIGDWSLGSRIDFLGPDENGKLSGMIGTIVANKPYELMSIGYIGFVDKGVEYTDEESIKDWKDARETYIFTPNDQGTLLQIEIDVEEKFIADFSRQWPQALSKLKELCEK